MSELRPQDGSQTTNCWMPSTTSLSSQEIIIQNKERLHADIFTYCSVGAGTFLKKTKNISMLTLVQKNSKSELHIFYERSNYISIITKRKFYLNLYLKLSPTSMKMSVIRLVIWLATTKEWKIQMMSCGYKAKSCETWNLNNLQFAQLVFFI